MRCRSGVVITPPRRDNPTLSFETTYGLSAAMRLRSTSFIVHDLGWQARNRFLGHLPEMKTIRSSGWSLRNAPNGIP